MFDILDVFQCSQLFSDVLSCFQMFSGCPQLITNILQRFSDVFKMCSDVLKCLQMFSDDHRCFWMFSGCSDGSCGPGGI